MSDPAVYPHAVRAYLASGPAYQPCPCADAAAELFDRLRRLRPDLTIQRLRRGAVVETTRPDLIRSVDGPLA